MFFRCPTAAGSRVDEAGSMIETEPETRLGGEAQAEADAAFIEAHMRRVFRLIYRVVNNVPDAQDLTQDAFVKALKRREQLRDDAKSGQWISRIAVNTALDFVRKRKRVVFEEIEKAPETPGRRRSKRFFAASSMPISRTGCACCPRVSAPR